MDKKSIDMPDININGNVNIFGPMFDIHDNQNVIFYNGDKEPLSKTKNNTDSGFKPKEETYTKTSDFEHLKVWQDNPDLDYYLSESHWNFHVNNILHKNLLVFYEGCEVGAFLDVKANRVTQPIKDYTPLYGKLFNEAYKLCNNILSLPVPETKVARFAQQAATWKFRNLNDEDDNPVGIAPNVMDLIESYHILGMANAILTFANDYKDAVDRFLIALSVYKDTGLYFRGYIHSFEHYNKVYEAFIFATLMDGSYLRPGYDNKKRNEYLRNNIPWFENLITESEKSKHEERKKQESENNNPTYINNYQQFNNCIFNEPVASPSSKKKPNTAKPKANADRKSSDKPMTLKYYKHGNNSLLMKQRNRVDIVFRKWNEWKWIDDRTTANDFDSFFEGEPRHCNIIWTANTTILTFLLQELLKQPYIEEQTGCSAKSLVEQQFGKKANWNKDRMDSEAEERIKIILIILDIRNPLPEPHRRGDDEAPDISDAALKAIYAGELRETKGV